MAQDIKSINFPCEENYTVRLCVSQSRPNTPSWHAKSAHSEPSRACSQKELVTYHNPSTHPMGSFELIASNRIRSDEETLGEIFNGQPYYTDKEPAEDPDFDWVPRKEQVFSDKQLMQLSVWKKEWDDDTNSYEPIDLGYKPYGYQQTRTWKKLGFLDEEGKLKSEGQLIEEGKVTDPEDVANYYKKQDTIKVLREEYCFKRAHAVECVNDKALKEKGSVEEALEWLRFHKERDFDEAMALKKKKDEGEEITVVEKEDEGKEEDFDK